MVQVQVRMPEKLEKGIDKRKEEGHYKSRSGAIKMVIAMYHESEKTKKFYNMLMQRSREAKEKPETLRRIT